MITEQIVELARVLEASQHVVVLTGAGASTEAGLPDWRGPEGMWKHWSPTRLASLSAMREHPVDFYQFYRYRLSRLRGVSPGPTQKALAALEQAGRIHTVITQNIDGLHQAAGSQHVIEVHGNLEHAVCIDCGSHYDADVLDVEVERLEQIPQCPFCTGMLKPSIVLFEEALPMDAIRRAFDAAERADLFLVVGSSLEVGPVNELPMQAVGAGAQLGIINMSSTHLDSIATYLLRGQAGAVLTELANRIGVELGGANRANTAEA